MHHFEHFIRVCEERGLSPWAEQVFCRLDKDPKTGVDSLKIIVGINGMRLIADRTGERDGSEPASTATTTTARCVTASVTVYRFYQRAPQVSYTGEVDFESITPAKECRLPLGSDAEGLSQAVRGGGGVARGVRAGARRDLHARGNGPGEGVRRCEGEEEEAAREAWSTAACRRAARSLEMFLIEKLNVTEQGSARGVDGAAEAGV
jgi:hypothetical protein